MLVIAHITVIPTIPCPWKLHLFPEVLSALSKATGDQQCVHLLPQRVLWTPGISAPPAKSSVCCEHRGFAHLQLILTFSLLPIPRAFIVTDVFPPSRPFVVRAELLLPVQALQQQRKPSCVSLGGLCLQWGPADPAPLLAGAAQAPA